jgi:hypothetical protein
MIESSTVNPQVKPRILYSSPTGCPSRDARGRVKVGATPVTPATSASLAPTFVSVAGAAALGRCGGGKMGSRSSGTPLYVNIQPVGLTWAVAVPVGVDAAVCGVGVSITV